MSITFDPAKKPQQNFFEGQKFQAPKTRPSQNSFSTISTALPEKNQEIRVVEKRVPSLYLFAIKLECF